MSTGSGRLLAAVVMLSGCGAAYQLSLERPPADEFVEAEGCRPVSAIIEKTHRISRLSSSGFSCSTIAL